MFPQCVQSTHMHIPVDLTIKNPHHKAFDHSMRVQFPPRYLHLTCTAVQSYTCVCASVICLPVGVWSLFVVTTTFPFESCSALSLQSGLSCKALQQPGSWSERTKCAAVNLGQVLIAAYADAVAQSVTWICLRGSSHFATITSHVSRHAIDQLSEVFQS